MTNATALKVDPTNIEQARAWDGDEGDLWAREADRVEGSLRAYQPLFMAAASIGAGDRVLDIGCGVGGATLEAAQRAASGSALGVDLSSQMLQVARARAARLGLSNASFEQADAQIHPFEAASYDVAISRTAAMFFGDKPVAFANIARALRPGGRLVLLVWQGFGENEWIRTFFTVLAAGRDLPGPPAEGPSPFSLSDPHRLRALLTSTGFGDPTIEDVRAPMWFGAHTDDAYEFLVQQLGWVLHGLDDDGRRRALDGLRAMIAAHESASGVEFGSAAWLVTAARS